MPRKRITHQQDPEKLASWRATIESQQASELTQAEYCRQNNLTENAFSYWKGVLFPERKSVGKKRRVRRKIQVLSPYERNKLVKKWEKSGLTQTEFCRRENIFEWQFSNWKTQMLKESKQAAKRSNTSFVEVKAEREKGVQDSAPAVNGTVAGSSRIVAQIHFSGGSIFIYSDAEVADLRKIVTVVAECGHERTQ
ncbi:MAG: hypothetical protein K2W95_01360 [Candidatus Obscuribacterales bacterium]|nr:hypothetical protein [Candidatus Obscuribacterales bacterium]